MQEIRNHNLSSEPSTVLQSSISKTGYESADISISPELGQISLAEKTARLTPVNMKVLVTLLERAGEVVSRGDIYQQVWSNQIVSDDTLTRAVSDIRAMFKSLEIETKLIETIPKRGYRWLASCVPTEEAVQPIFSHAIDTRLNEKNNVINKKPKESTHFLNSVPVWLKWLFWSVAAIIFFSSLIAATIWLVKGQLNDPYVKLAMMPVSVANNEHIELVNLLSEVLQQRVLKTKDLRLLSSRTSYNRQQSLIPYLADEFSAKWLIEVDIKTSKDKVKITLDLVDAKSAVVLDSINQSINPNKKELEQLVDSFVERMVSKSN